MILKWSHLLLLFHLFNHLKVPSHECSNSFPLIATVMTLDPCLQSWHHAQLTTEAVPSSALTLNTTTRAPTKPRQELSATANLDSLCWMTGGRVVVSILMFCFFVFPQSFHWDLNILPESSVDAPRHGVQWGMLQHNRQQGISFTCFMTLMFHGSQTSISELWNLWEQDRLVALRRLYNVSSYTACLTDNLSFVRAISGWCWSFLNSVIISVHSADSPVQTDYSLVVAWKFHCNEIRFVSCLVGSLGKKKEQLFWSSFQNRPFFLVQTWEDDEKRRSR